MTDKNQSPRPQLLDRDFLASNNFHEQVAARAPGARLLSEAQLLRSLQATLDERPDAGNGVWIFAYGSLIWSCPLIVSTQRVAEIRGWHRSLCLSNVIGRGSPETPGLTMALEAGGQCTGIAMHVPEDTFASELAILWRREMILDSYRPQWVEVCDAEGMVFGSAITFAVNYKSEEYLEGISYAEVVHRMATGSGLLGSSADYLFQTLSGLNAEGIEDPDLDELVKAVKRAMAQTG
jgi:glutathione-specific gamma-glutamylcyclotransferase